MYIAYVIFLCLKFSTRNLLYYLYIYMNLVILGIGTQIYLAFKENIHPISGMHFIVNINLYSKTEHMYIRYVGQKSKTWSLYGSTDHNIGFRNKDKSCSEESVAVEIWINRAMVEKHDSRCFSIILWYFLGHFLKNVNKGIFQKLC